MRIRPSRGWVALRLDELWAYRELFGFLTWRDIKLRYKQTVLGVAWAILQPVLTMVIFSLFFGRLAKIPSDRLPYPIFAFAALVPWTFFANGLNQASNSLVGSTNLITKVYFPRLVIPVASVVAGLGRSRPRFGGAVRDDALLRHYPTAAGSVVTGLPGSRRGHDAGRRAMAIGAERSISRRALCGPVPHANLDVRNAHRLSE